MIVAVLLWKDEHFGYGYSFFSPCFVGINCCNVTQFLFRIFSFQNIICNNFVPNGRVKYHAQVVRRGVGVERGSLDDGSLAVLQSALPSFCACPTKMEVKEAIVTSLAFRRL